LSLPEKSTNKSQINWLLLSLLQYCYSSCTVLEMSHTSDCGDRSKLAFSTVPPPPPPLNFLSPGRGTAGRTQVRCPVWPFLSGLLILAYHQHSTTIDVVVVLVFFTETPVLRPDDYC
jgi:hypothetical protein